MYIFIYIYVYIKHLQNINKGSLINQSAYRRSARKVHLNVFPHISQPRRSRLIEVTQQLLIGYNINVFFFLRSKELTVINFIKYSQHQCLFTRSHCEVWLCPTLAARLFSTKLRIARYIVTTEMCVSQYNNTSEVIKRGQVSLFFSTFPPKPHWVAGVSGSVLCISVCSVL